MDSQEKISWISCCICKTPPTYEVVKQKLSPIVEISRSDYIKACEAMTHKPHFESDPIYEKIQNGTVTSEDFNKLISEAMPECSRDRVRRRTLDKNHDSYDEQGHDKFGEPNLADRVQPKIEKEPGEQMTHGGKAGHRRSTRTQRRKSKFSEAINFVQNNIGKSINEYSGDLDSVSDREALYEFVTALMKKEGINRDWLYEVRSKMDGTLTDDVTDLGSKIATGAKKVLDTVTKKSEREKAQQEREEQRKKKHEAQRNRPKTKKKRERRIAARKEQKRREDE